MKFDFTKIPGFKPDMSAEDMLKLFSDHDFDAVSKATLDKATSEAADYKKKYNATLTDNEKRDAEAAENFKKMETELNSLRREKAVSKATADYLALGYDKDLAVKTAEALADGKQDVVFANQQKHQEAWAAKMKAELLKGTPAPGATEPGSGENDYQKMAQEAQSRGDFANAAYYTRLATTQTNE